MTSGGKRYRGRFAPSPTGPLHFGSLVAALASYCDAAAAGGEWLVRIEDVDEPRSRESAATAILSTLEAYGFRWQSEVVRQSARSELYQAALDRLMAKRSVYPCACTRKELESAPVGAGGERVYPGTCRTGVAPGGDARAWRMRVGDEVVGFRDRLQGWQEQRLERDVGDFVVKRADGMFAYQLA
ncbi:MAG TPA: glutamate--tRNA ligase family protein, partial [Caldimonas sp.]|nr:glutamate--tRNA ligase family protein [Caldimonas sp.]